MNKIHTLSITCLAGRHLSQAYRFVVAMPSEATLDDLAFCILDTLDFDGDHLADFYVANTPRGKRTWFTPSGDWEDGGNDLNPRLCDIFPLEKHKKLYFEYDPGASWRFEIARTGRETNAVAEQAYPYLVREEGVKPLEHGAD
jgi:hypothetical protein